jgi:serine/threonine protein kinase
MMDYAFTAADPDYYEPLEAGPRGKAYGPTAPPAGWSRVDNGVWTMWQPPRAAAAGQGWKVHVSSSLANTGRVLDAVCAICTQLRVPFKHLATERFFLAVHDKHGSRVSSGKFCAAYPPDEETARELLARLESELADLEGPYVLTDRRFGASRCVSYRYGAFVDTHTLAHDGVRLHTMQGGDGEEIPDERRPMFLLPAGVLDPFTPLAEAAADGPASFGGYTFERVIQHSNAGGSYQACGGDGGRVFIKEARAHNGYLADGRDAKARLHAEYRVLRDIHARCPGLCPAPVEVFDHWENSYLVTELIAGDTLRSWMGQHMPLTTGASEPADFTDYYRRCLAILDRIAAALTTLHELGYVFTDLNPNNVMVGDDDQVRLVDFEAAQRIGGRLTPMAAPGYFPREVIDPTMRDAPATRYVDQYALSAIALTMLLPIHEVIQRSPEVLPHVRHSLTHHAPVPDPLWDRATRYHPRPRWGVLPAPAEVAAEPLVHLRWLRDQTATALERMAASDNPRWSFPTTPQGLRTNTRCIAHGTAGVLHALELAGRPADPAILAQLRDESLALRDDTPPGLLFGSAGIAWVLARLGEPEAAADLLAAASASPLATRYATLGGGAAGIAMAHLAFYCQARDQRHLDMAWRLLDSVPRGGELLPALGPDEASGLVHGRPGIALALYYLGKLSSDPGPLARGLDLLREELRLSVDRGPIALGFHASQRDRRNLPYLFAGSAGYAHVVTRYVAEPGAADLAEPLDQCLRACDVRLALYAGLFQGLAGLALVHGEAARLASRPHLGAASVASASALFQYAVPGSTGVRFIGDGNMRFSADLWSGSAGVLLSLQQAIEPRPDPLFTLDQAVAEAEWPGGLSSGAAQGLAAARSSLPAHFAAAPRVGTPSFASTADT